MILARLRAETRPHHDAVEAKLGVLDEGLTAGGYRRLLRAFLGYYAPVEARLAGQPWAALGFAWEPRRKAWALEQDLIALGDRGAVVPWCDALPPLDTVPQALGCVYVLEGATLGGRVITRHLRGRPGDPLPTAFFGCYGDNVGRMWQEFGAFLTGYAAGRADDDAIVASACATFATLGAWLASQDRS